MLQLNHSPQTSAERPSKAFLFLSWMRWWQWHLWAVYANKQTDEAYNTGATELTEIMPLLLLLLLLKLNRLLSFLEKSRFFLDEDEQPASYASSYPANNWTKEDTVRSTVLHAQQLLKNSLENPIKSKFQKWKKVITYDVDFLFQVLQRLEK